LTPREDADRVFLILARDFHLQQDEIDRKSATSPNWAPSSSRSGKFGLLEGTPLHDVTRRGSPLL